MTSLANIELRDERGELVTILDVTRSPVSKQQAWIRITDFAADQELCLFRADAAELRNIADAFCAAADRLELVAE